MSDIPVQADPRGTASYRAARLAVIVLTALIILALVGLAVGMALKLTGRSNPAASHVAGAVFILPTGARIVSLQTQPGRLIVQVHSEQGDEIDIVGLDDGQLIARIRPAPRP